MEKRMLTMIITIMLIVSFSINVFSANEITNSEDTNAEVNNLTLEEQQQQVEEKLTQSNNRLEYVQSEISVAVQKIQKLDEQIVQHQKEYDEINKEIQEIENQISTTEIQLLLTQIECQRKEELLRKRIVALYKAGNTTYLDVLLNSEGIVDFLSNYYMLERIIEYDSDLINEVEEQKQLIEAKKREQEEKRNSLKEKRAKATQVEIQLRNNKMLQENYSSKLTEEEKNLQEEIAKYKAEQESIENQIQAALGWSGTLAIQYTGGQMIWPVGIEGTYITSGYGSRLHPIQGVYRYHDGLDIGNAGFGAPVVAAADGVVTYTGTMGGYGNCVIVSHGDGLATLYAHGQEIKTSFGTSVKQGDVIMLVGSTGNSTGPHLHFEVRKDGVVVDPIPYLRGENNN